METISYRRENRLQLMWLIGLWTVGFVPQWLFWSQGWNGIGALMAFAGVPLAGTTLAVAIGTRDRALLIAGCVIGLQSAAVLFGADEQLRARVTWFANRSYFERTVKEMISNPAAEPPPFGEVDRSRGQPAIAFGEDIGPCCEWKSIVYDPTGRVMAANESENPSTPFESRVIYASHMFGPWYYSVLVQG